MNIALTGSTGFIGSALIKSFTENASFKIFTFNKNKHIFSSIKSLKDLVENKDIVIHAAGITQASNTDDFYTVNSTYTRNLLEAISLYGEPNTKFIFFSSFAVYETVTTPTLLDEDKTITIPRNDYGRSKLLAEGYIKTYHQEKNIDGYILRLSNAYGPGMKQTTRSIIYNCIKSIQTNTPLLINGDGEQTRDFIYIDDIIQAVTKSIYNTTDDLITINICSSEETKINDIIKKTEYLLGKPAVIQINKNNIEKGYWIGNNQKAFETIGFKPKTTLDKGLKTTIEWYIKNTI